MKRKQKSSLPRLTREWYCGDALVFWTHTLEGRAAGWLNDAFHWCFREILLHACVRERLVCPLYVLMPDHIHLLWQGGTGSGDQLLATRYLRREIGPLLRPFQLQDQAHDHVLREEERERDAFRATWSYIAMNPVRAGLVENWKDYPYIGACYPGFWGVDPRAEDYWKVTAKVVDRCLRQVDALGKHRDDCSQATL